MLMVIPTFRNQGSCFRRQVACFMRSMIDIGGQDVKAIALDTNEISC